MAEYAGFCRGLAGTSRAYGGLSGRRRARADPRRKGRAVQATMTCAGLDVHARSTHAAAIDLLTGEQRRARFVRGRSGGGLSGIAPRGRCADLRRPTGFGLAQSAAAAGIEVIVAAPSKTPRAKGDRVKSDRKDAELLARLLLAGQLKAVAIPPDWLEAIRHLARTREQVRRDLGRARHRVSKLLLVEGRVYPGKTTWNRRPPSLAGRAAVRLRGQPSWRSSICSPPSTGWWPAARRSTSACPRLAADERLWPTVARLRAFRGVDTLTALGLHLELGRRVPRAIASRATARTPSWRPGSTASRPPFRRVRGAGPTYTSVRRPSPIARVARPRTRSRASRRRKTASGLRRLAVPATPTPSAASAA